VTGPPERLRGQPTPEVAALLEWAGTQGADPRVRAVTVRGDRAEVVIEVGPSYEDWVYCVRRSDGWHGVVSGNGPTVAWDDPSELQWDGR
jgi:hypothetical protein